MAVRLRAGEGEFDRMHVFISVALGVEGNHVAVGSHDELEVYVAAIGTFDRNPDWNVTTATQVFAIKVENEISDLRLETGGGLGLVCWARDLD